VGSSAIFFVLAVEVRRKSSLVVDRLVLHALRVPSGRPAPYRDLRVLGDVAGAPGTIAIVAVVIAALVGIRRRGAALFFACAVAVAALSEPLKLLFDRPSRRGVHGAFFPSGHAMGSMAVAAAVVAVCWNTRFRVPVALTAFIAVVVVGLTAVFYGDHWPTDVLGGWSLSLAWVSLVCTAAVLWRTRDKRGELGES
jgi:undecaprenyl-diphosphatase